MLLQIVLTLLLTFTSIEAIPPPGHKAKPQEPDEHPPKYEYGYNIADEKGRGQGKMETRDGIYALGRYYVQGSASSQSVEYLADDWGFHPYVEYSSTGPHSRTITQFALGKEAVKAFKNNNKEIFDPKIPLSESVKKLHEPDAPAQNQLPDAPRKHRPSVVASEIRARTHYAKNDGGVPQARAQTQEQQPQAPQQVVVIPTATLLGTPQPSEIVLIPQPTQQSLPVNVMILPPQQTSEAYQQAQPLQNPPINFLVPVADVAQPPQALLLQDLQNQPPQYIGRGEEGNDDQRTGAIPNYQQQINVDYQQQSEPKLLLTPYAQNSQEGAQDFYQQEQAESDRLIQQENVGAQNENDFALSHAANSNNTQVQGEANQEQGQSDLAEFHGRENQEVLNNENLSYETIPQPEKLIAPQSQEEYHQSQGQFHSEQQQQQFLQQNLPINNLEVQTQENGQFLQQEPVPINPGVQQQENRQVLQLEPVPINLGVQMVKEVTKQQLLDNVQGQEKFQSGGYQQLVHDDNLKLEHQQQLIQQFDVAQTNQNSEGLGGLIINVQDEQVENSNRKTKVLDTDSILNVQNGTNTITNQEGQTQEDGFVHFQQGIYNSPSIYHNQEGEQGSYFQGGNSNQQYHLQNLPLQIDERNVLKNVLLTQKSAYYGQPQIVGEYTAERTSTEAAPLYQQQGNANQNVYDGAYNVESLGGFGSKVISNPESDYDRYVNTYRARPSKLIESTKNLVNGMDVLSINEAVAQQNYDEVESSTAKSVTNSIEQDLVLPGQPSQLSDVHVETSASTSNYEQHSSVSSSTTTSPLIFVDKINEPAPYALSLQNNPIVVGDYEENNLRAAQNREVQEKQEYFSTTQSTIETVDSNQNAQTTEATVVVTPRPTSTTNLFAEGQSEKAEEEGKKSQPQNFLVEIQESVPFYVGKFEYLQNPTDASKKKLSSTYTQQQKAIDDLELGQSLLDFPLPEGKRKSNSELVDQLQEQGQVQQVKKLPPDGNKEKLINHLDLPYEITNANYYQYHLPPTGEASLEIPHQIQSITDTKPKKKVVEKVVTKVIEKLVPQPYPVEKIVERPVHIPVEVTKFIDRPYPVHVAVPHRVPYPVEKIVEKYINRPYPVEVPIRVPVQVPVQVEKRVPVPYPVEKIVEKPVIKIVEKPVPQPYPVEKLVEKPVQVPVEVTKYVDRPVQVPVAQPVPYPVPVEKVVEKIVNKPYPVEVRVPVQVPHPVPVEKIVEKKVPVQVQVPVPVAQAYVVPVEVPRPYPVHITKLVPQPYPVQVTHTVKVPVAVRVPHPVPVEVPKYIDRPFPIYVDKESQKHYQYYYYPNPYSYAPDYQPVTTNKQPIVAYGVPSYSVANLRQPIQIQSTQATYAQYGVPVVQQNSGTPHLEYGAPNVPVPGIAKNINQNEYIGLVPPPEEPRRGVIGGYRKNRQARHNFEFTPKLEYGFMPPLIPSLEIDENGNPIEKEES